MLRLKTMHRRCFSLMEVMVVLLIIGLIVGIATPAYMNHLRKAQQRTTRDQIRLLSEAVDAYFLDLNEYPRNISDLVTSTGNNKWDGPYMKNGVMPKDAWGNDFQYAIPGSNGRQYDIYSYGSDRAPGGTGADLDIYADTEL